MCGFVVIWDASAQRSPASLAACMAAALAHRGPDDAGAWTDERSGITIAHRRLSIVDLSAQGHQPMCSADGQWVLAFNGEIYNHRHLARRLGAAGAAFRGHSDTEVLVEALAAWGLEAALAEAEGMFAFAAWHAPRRTLHLARDRMGEKPLYYGLVGGRFVCASELKAIHAGLGDSLAPDRGALAAALQLAYVPAPRSAYRGIRKLPPGCRLELADPSTGGEAEPLRYWRLPAPASGTAAVSAAEAQAELGARLGESVALRLHADVPVGVFLSGGIDSSTVAAFAQAASAQPVKTFTVGFDFAGFDEAPFARRIAEHLGTEHHETRVSAGDALALIPRLAEIYDEPFADSSQIPTLLIAAAARREVKVILSGDGADELFGGYYRHFLAGRLRRLFAVLPLALRRRLARLLLAVPPARWESLVRGLERLLPARLRPLPPGERVHKLAGILDAPNMLVAYQRLVSVGFDNGAAPDGAGDAPLLWDAEPAAAMMHLDALTYLPDDILVKLDRATMACSLEARVPFLDHRLVELAAAMPAGLNLAGGGKAVLKALLAERLPRACFERPKMGFAVPLAEWLRGDLREWAEALLSDSRLSREGLIDAAQVQRAWREHLGGQRNWQYALWPVLMTEAWWRRWQG